MPESLELSGQSGQVHRCASKGEANFASHYCAFKRGQTMISFFHGEKISAKEGHGPILSEYATGKENFHPTANKSSHVCLRLFGY